MRGQLLGRDRDRLAKAPDCLLEAADLSERRAEEEHDLVVARPVLPDSFELPGRLHETLLLHQARRVLGPQLRLEAGRRRREEAFHLLVPAVEVADLPQVLHEVEADLEVAGGRRDGPLKSALGPRVLQPGVGHGQLVQHTRVARRYFRRLLEFRDRFRGPAGRLQRGREDEMTLRILRVELQRAARLASASDVFLFWR